MKNIKTTLLIFILAVIALIGCSGSEIESQAIIEDIVLNKSTYQDIENILPNMSPGYHLDETGKFMVIEEGVYYTDYTINNIDGNLMLIFDIDSDVLAGVRFAPKDKSKEYGDSLKTWLFNKYTNYEQTTKDTGFVFSNGVENVELYITENPKDSNKYYGLYIEWSIQE